MKAMGKPLTLVSVEDYLHTSYSPDYDYVDGVLEDRNVGEKDHSKAQKKLLRYLDDRSGSWNIFVIQEQRVQVSKTRYRVPDICVMLGPEPDEQIFTQPPFLCIEILSPEDRISRMQERINDYFTFGVRHVWLIDPWKHQAWSYTPGEIREVRDGVLRTVDPELSVPLEAIFNA